MTNERPLTDFPLPILPCLLGVGQGVVSECWSTSGFLQDPQRGWGGATAGAQREAWPGKPPRITADR